MRHIYHPLRYLPVFPRCVYCPDNIPVLPALVAHSSSAAVVLRHNSLLVVARYHSSLVVALERRTGVGHTCSGQELGRRSAVAGRRSHGKALHRGELVEGRRAVGRLGCICLPC